MPRRIYSINGLTFHSQEELNNYTRQLINKIGIGGRIYPNDEYFNYFDDLLKHHEGYIDKIGCGIKFLFIKNCKYNNPQLNIHRIDGTNIDIAYMYSKKKFCCENKHKIYLELAMRYAIKDFTISYKNSRDYNNTLICDICNADNLERDSYQTDHIYPFCEIKKEFLKNNTLPIPTEFDDLEYTKAFELKDIEFETSWVNFHNSYNNNYQLLCKTCNGKKGGRVIN